MLLRVRRAIMDGTTATGGIIMSTDTITTIIMKVAVDVDMPMVMEMVMRRKGKFL